MITGSRFAGEVAEAGAAHVPLVGSADLDERRLFETLPARAELNGLAAARFDMEHIFLDPLPDQLKVLDASMNGDPAEVVVAEPLFLAALALVGRSHGPRVLTLGTMPPLGRHSAMPPMGEPLRLPGPLAGAAHLAMHRMVQRVLFDGLQRRADTVLARLGEPTPATFFLDWPSAGAGVIQLSVPSFEPIAGLGVPVHHVGTLATAHDVASSPSWWARVEQANRDGVPVVHVTQGRVANFDLDQLLGPTLRALAGRPALVVATTGGADPASVTDVPANAVVDRWIDYDLLLPHTAAMVTNGGYGGVHEALRHGVPIVLAGAQQDKAAIGTRLSRSGAGVAVATQRPAERTLDELVGRVLFAPRYRAAAERIAAELAAAPGLAGAVAVVESELLGALEKPPLERETGPQ